MRANNLKPGNALKLNGKLYIVIQVDHRTPGNLRAFVQAKLKDIAGGGYIEKRFASTEDVEGVTLDRRKMEYLYSDQHGHTFMDLEDYEQHSLAADFVGTSIEYLKPNTEVQILVHEETPLQIELPGTVELEVTETPPMVKGATATNQLKEATLETGLKTRVPPFIENGQIVRVSTADGSYQARVSS